MRVAGLLLVAGCGRLGFDAVAPADAVASDTSIEIVITGYGAVTASADFACIDHCVHDFGGPIELGIVASDGWTLSATSPPCASATVCNVQPGTQIALVFAQDAITANRAFVSSAAPIASVGRGGFDQICRDAATAQGLSGTFLALVSTSSEDAVARLAGSRGWVRFDGLPVLDQPTDLGMATAPRAVQFDEAGTAITSFVHSGSDAMGRYVAGQTCADWSTTASGNAALGFSSECSTFMYRGLSSCGNAEHVFCFEVGHVAPQTVAPRPFPAGRFVFSSTTVMSLVGVAGLDATCVSEAQAAGLPGTYRALAATTTESPAERVGGVSGLWRRPDRGVVAHAGLDEAALEAGVNQSAAGSFVPGSAWWGAATITSRGTAATTCGDWLDTASASAPALAVLDDGTVFKLPAGGFPCTNPQQYHVLCAQLP